MRLHFSQFLIFLSFSLLVFSCVSQGQNNEFYLALLNESNDEKIALFEKALSSPNEYIRRAAAEELAILMTQGYEISPKTMGRVHKEARDHWAAAFEITSSPDVNRLDKEKIYAFLLDVQHNNVSFNQARFYVLSELEKMGYFFSWAEMAVIEAHNAAFQLRYNDALESFRYFQESEAMLNGVPVNRSWPDEIPEILLENPNLINDLGRAFQFTSANREGLDLFLKWESSLSGQSDDLRFRLVFFAARIARRMGQNTQAVSLFEKALELAPDYEQLDACIWYLLDAAIEGSTAVFYEKLEKFIPIWHSASYFNSIMERYLVRLVTGREWRRIIRTYNLIKDTNINIRGGYAWVTARAMEENFLNSEDTRLASGAVNVSVENLNPGVFLNIAYNAGVSMAMPALYYRMQSAIALEMPLLVFAQEEPSIKKEDAPFTDVYEFLAGFFRNEAAALSVPYLRAMESVLAPHEMRALAEILHSHEMYPQSMRMVSLYLYRTDFKKEKRDFELMYPRPFLELIETNASQFGIDPWLFFGLIRTESAFQSAVVSHAGAVGLSQLMPSTARDQADRIKRGGGPDFFCEEGAVDSTDPNKNVYIGAFYFNSLMGRFENKQLALMAYNGGATRVRRWQNASRLPVDLLVETVPIYETRDYGRRVPAIGQIYFELYYKDVQE